MEIQNIFHLADIYRISQSIVPWFFSTGIKIIAIVIGAGVVDKIGRILIEKSIRELVKPDMAVPDYKEAERKREDTLIRIFNNILRITIILVLVLSILPQFGIDITGLLAGAGIVGIALGLGARSLIQDFLAGIFIILENVYRIGDVVCLDGTCGAVENITLRKTVLRDLDGVQHHISNGSIKKASNLSKDFARVNLNVGIAYNSDLKKVIEVVNRVGKELAEDPEWKDSILKPPQFVRVDDFADSAMIIKIVGDTKPLKQWAVTGELRKRLKIAFDKENIEIPFPQMVIWQRGIEKK
ncbi:MAG TPA: mechanosensitive ion channel family protein [bacterium]|nr:mechanosensitive ion channel family protein [bacterium]